MIPTRQDSKLLILAVDSATRRVGLIYTSIANFTRDLGSYLTNSRKAEYRRI
ncbi:hypothetical protein M0657_011995 [Pyricularia oryzae]|nr:hypothetical protein M9X92_012209 [Pyricularia oryzae]KAI7909090.1 hypothetical protein M0657_011995 [Pyricularia oryzae]